MTSGRVFSTLSPAGGQLLRMRGRARISVNRGASRTACTQLAPSRCLGRPLAEACCRQQTDGEHCMPLLGVEARSGHTVQLLLLST